MPTGALVSAIISMRFGFLNTLLILATMACRSAWTSAVVVSVHWAATKITRSGVVEFVVQVCAGPGYGSNAVVHPTSLGLAQRLV